MLEINLEALKSNVSSTTSVLLYRIKGYRTTIGSIKDHPSVTKI